MNLPERPITILVAALGGEGGGVLADWLVAAATAESFPVQSTSIPGVAQRTGATTYYVEIYPARWDTLDGKAPYVMAGTLERAVELAAGDAETCGAPSPVVLLSPACASYDQFKDFEHRGDVFRDAVVKLRASLMLRQAQHEDESKGLTLSLSKGEGP